VENLETKKARKPRWFSKRNCWNCGNRKTFFWSVWFCYGILQWKRWSSGWQRNSECRVSIFLKYLSFPWVCQLGLAPVETSAYQIFSRLLVCFLTDKFPGLSLWQSKRFAKRGIYGDKDSRRYLIFPASFFISDKEKRCADFEHADKCSRLLPTGRESFLSNWSNSWYLFSYKDGFC